MRKKLEGLNDLSLEVYELNQKKGFWETSNFAEKLALIHAEVSEALEADRAGRWSNKDVKVNNYYKNALPTFKENPDNYMASFQATIKDTVEDELADTFIRLLDLCGRHQIDIEKHIELKYMYNSLRPFKHGKRY
jgi:NTP pyrophosphatase (non-canonical NTP hydrolase)